jgi:hypothetical protein
MKAFVKKLKKKDKAFIYSSIEDSEVEFVFERNNAGLKKVSQILSRRLKWPRGLRQELSSPVPTLRSWVRIPQE